MGIGLLVASVRGNLGNHSKTFKVTFLDFEKRKNIIVVFRANRPNGLTEQINSYTLAFGNGSGYAGGAGKCIRPTELHFHYSEHSAKL